MKKKQKPNPKDNYEASLHKPLYLNKAYRACTSIQLYGLHFLNKLWVSLMTQHWKE